MVYARILRALRLDDLDDVDLDELPVVGLGRRGDLGHYQFREV